MITCNACLGTGIDYGDRHGPACTECGGLGVFQGTPDMPIDDIQGESPPEETVSQARERIMAARQTKAGGICPCCDKYAKIYKRSVNASSLKVLKDLYFKERKTPRGWVKIGFGGELHTDGGDYAKMRWWGLIENCTARREDGSTRNGLWRITELGMDFIEKKARIRKYVYEYNNEPVLDPPDADLSLVFIHEAWSGFNFDEIKGYVGVEDPENPDPNLEEILVRR